MLQRACHTATVALPRVAATQAAERRSERVFHCTGVAESPCGAVLRSTAQLSPHFAGSCVCWPGIAVHKKYRAQGTISLRRKEFSSHSVLR